MREIICDDVFVESVFRTTFNNINKENILKYIDFLVEKGVEGVTLSNVGGWQYHVPHGENEDIMLLIEELQQSAHQVLAEHYGFNVKSLRVANIWINVNNKHDYNQMHTHVGSILSSVYYLDIPEDCSSPIMFETSNYYARQNQINDIGDKGEDVEFMWHGPRTAYRYEIEPEEGVAYFFNPDLNHAVGPNRSDKPRISIAANFIC